MIKYLSAVKKKNLACGKHFALLYVCDSRVPILYHVSKSIPWVLSIPWVHVYTMSLCQYHESMYHESMSIPWVHVYTMSPCLYYESMSILWVHVYTMSLCLYHESMSVWYCTISLFLYHEFMYIPLEKQINKRQKGVRINNQDYWQTLLNIQDHFFIKGSSE